MPKAEGETWVVFDLCVTITQSYAEAKTTSRPRQRGEKVLTLGTRALSRCLTHTPQLTHWPHAWPLCPETLAVVRAPETPPPHPRGSFCQSCWQMSQTAAAEDTTLRLNKVREAGRARRASEGLLRCPKIKNWSQERECLQLHFSTVARCCFSCFSVMHSLFYSWEQNPLCLWGLLTSHLPFTIIWVCPFSCCGARLGPSLSRFLSIFQFLQQCVNVHFTHLRGNSHICSTKEKAD